MSFAGLEIGIHIASVKQMGILEVPDIRVNAKVGRCYTVHIGHCF